MKHTATKQQSDGGEQIAVVIPSGETQGDHVSRVAASS